jgi:hypothetical protein
MRRSLSMAVLAAVLGIALGGQADAARSSAEGRSIGPGGVIGVPAQLPCVRPLPLPWTDAPLGLPGAIGAPPALAPGALSPPAYVPSAPSPTCLGARASRGPPVVLFSL